MLSFTLQQLFGENASQSATELVIKKADLVVVGLNLNPNNTAESLLVAILLRALENFQGIIVDESNQAITDENNHPISFDNRNIWELLEIFRWAVHVPDGFTDRIRYQIIIYSYTSQ